MEVGNTEDSKNLQNCLQNASIHSIRIPLIPKVKNEPSDISFKDRSFNNPFESDLTELSWLTNNVQFFKNNTVANLQLPIKKQISKKNKDINKKLHNTNTNQYTYLLNRVHKFKDYHQLLNQTTSPQVTCVDDDFYSSSSSSTSSSSQFMSLPVSPASSTTSSNSTSPRPLAYKNQSILNNKKLSMTASISYYNSIENSSKTISEEQIITHVRFKNNCGMNKPQLTLSCLIFMALQESKEKCLPVREIYEWIEENFPFYKNVSNGGWKSSIRHNLSFSKCFKKMDRTESVLYRGGTTVPSPKEPFSSLIINSEINFNGRKRRAPNTTGTCWTVNNECKSYLIQTLKKSSFWFHNNKFYPSLYTLILEHINTNSLNIPAIEKLNHYSSDINDEDIDENLNNINNNLIGVTKKYSNSKLENNNNKKFKIENYLIEKDDSETEEEKQNNLIKFVQKQQEELCKNNIFINQGKVPETKNGLDLSLSASSSSLAAAFSLLSSSSSLNQLNHSSNVFSSSEFSKNNSNSGDGSTESSMNFNSDLEMEVASTLVDMKFFAVRNKNQLKN